MYNSYVKCEFPRFRGISSSTISFWRYTLCLNDTSVRFARKVWQHLIYLWKIMIISRYFFQRIHPFLIIFDCSFIHYLSILLQSAFQAYRSLCNLNALIGKQTTVTLSFYFHTSVLVEKQSKLKWRPNTFMNLSDFM